ncbi:MAG: adenosylcobinamide-GDP ribazoletransferase [Nocardioidaceae bacterium]|nr:adenosylcobinamide-GDP ribazoletransferase [Nocardioidaceae bacterium]
MIAVRAIVAAFSFLTILPFGRLVALDGRDVARGSVLFPVVGATIGALTGGLAWVLGDQLPSLLAAVLAVAAGVLVTGALHLDGLADCADGFGARTPEDRLRVMRDHTNGTYGGSALLLDLMIRVAALAALAGSRDALLISVAAGALSRVAGPILAARLPYAQGRPGAGEALNANPSGPRAGVTYALGALIAFAVVDVRPWSASLLATVVVVGAVGWLAKRRLGGVTGDVMGAASELVELTVLVLAVALL